MKGEIGNAQIKNTNVIMQNFIRRQTRQIIAIAATLFSVMLLAVLYKRPDLFGTFSQNTLAAVQVLLAIGFVSYTAFNWRCPSCGKHLGGNINRRTCSKCNVRLH